MSPCTNCAPCCVCGGESAEGRVYIESLASTLAEVEADREHWIDVAVEMIQVAATAEAETTAVKVALAEALDAWSWHIAGRGCYVDRARIIELRELHLRTPSPAPPPDYCASERSRPRVSALG